jgi:hypothetical protein
LEYITRKTLYFLGFIIIIFMMSSEGFAGEITNPYIKRRIREFGIKIVPNESGFTMKSSPADDATVIYHHQKPTRDIEHTEFYIVDQINIDTPGDPDKTQNDVPAGWHLVAKQTIYSAIPGWVKDGTFMFYKEYVASEKERTVRELAQKRDVEKQKKEEELSELYNEVKVIKSRIPKHLANKYGFKDIPFGSPHLIVKKILQLEYGSKNLLFDDDNKYIWLKCFSLGQEEVGVTFFFDHNKEFYSFEFKGDGRTANYIDTLVYSDGQYLNSVFKNKYGNPQKCIKAPNIFHIKTGFVTYLCKWNYKEMEIFTGFNTYEFKYYAIGYVGSKKMTLSYEKYLKTLKDRGVINGTKRF